MRIVICNTLYPPLGIGGAERSVQYLAEALAKRNHEVTVLTQGASWFRRVEKREGVRVVRTSSPLGYRPNVFNHRSFMDKVFAQLLKPIAPQRGKMYLEEILALKPDVVHTNALGYLEEIWEGVANAGIPVVHTLRNHGSLCPLRMFAEGKACDGQCDRCAYRTRARRWGGERLSGVVGISSYILQEYLTSGYFADIACRRVIPNSYAPKVPPKAPEPASDGVLRLGYLGRLHETKGILELINAMKSFESEPVRLIVGGTGNPKFFEKLKRMAPPNVSFSGFVDAEKFLGQVDGLVVPSLWREPFGRVYAEALVHGVPVIGSIHGAGRELIHEGVTGWICDPSNSESLIQAIHRAVRGLKEDAGFRERCLRAGERFSVDAVAAAYEDVYAQVIAQGPTPKPKRSLQSRLSASVLTGGI